MKKSKWNEEIIINELKKIIEDIGHFPKYGELGLLNYSGLLGAIDRNGGINKFRKLFGLESIIKPNNYWNDEVILKELKPICEKLEHFPTGSDFVLLDITNLVSAIKQYGGFVKFRKLLGYEPHSKPKGYWTYNIIIDELKIIIDKLDRFPTHEYLISINKKNLIGAIYKFGGINKFKIIFGYDSDRKPMNYWTENKTIDELKEICNTLGHFPTKCELSNINRNDLVGAINQNGGINKFRKLFGYEYIIKPNNYWNDEKVIKELKQLISNLKHFPTKNELVLIDRQDLSGAIYNYGGINKFRELCGYPILIYEKYFSDLMSYSVKRGKSTEKFLKQILHDYCLLHNLPEPEYNKKLCKGNVIEFVCNTNKTIGVDVTNTRSLHGGCIKNKWKHQDYHKHLDELWIVVFSNIITEQDYIELNNNSPSNVKVFSIYNFLKELDYSLDEHTKSKIDKYNQCSFHTKEQFVRKK